MNDAERTATLPRNEGGLSYQAVEERARLLERQRLARDLHDSVSQALYGIVLGVETAWELARQDPQRVVEPLRYVGELAQVGLAEMRAIILGLRPQSLENEGLVVTLLRQASAFEGQHGLFIEKVLPVEPTASMEVKEALLRIVQEALHNIVKHARARHVQLRLERVLEDVVLEIADDGIGFDCHRDFPGHLGLLSMRERVENLGGRLTVMSTVGDGTRVRVQVPLRGE